MSRFAFEKPHPNYPAAGKRPQHNMTPVVILKNGNPYAGIGMPGGQRIVTVTGQIITNLIDFNSTPQQAVFRPRFHTDGGPLIQVGADMPLGVIEELRRRGQRVEYLEPLGGEANAIVIERASGEIRAAASKNSTGVFVF
jgi:gamma-glutamyltranspeptidase/glutathione hydrolase